MCFDFYFFLNSTITSSHTRIGITTAQIKRVNLVEFLIWNFHRMGKLFPFKQYVRIFLGFSFLTHDLIWCLFCYSSFSLSNNFSFHHLNHIQKSLNKKHYHAHFLFELKTSQIFENDHRLRLFIVTGAILKGYLK
jgi:hypothetical protein